MVPRLLGLAAMSSRVLMNFVIVSLISGCFYARGNLEQKKGVYKHYPGTIEEEQARRKTRRRTALIASPLELIGGTGLAALALFAKSTPMDDGNDSVVDNLGDAGKELAGRLLLASIGAAVAVGGAGDLVFGLVDPLHSSPLVRDGVLVGADRIDLIEPPRAPRFSLHMGSVIGTHTLGSDVGFGLAHWLDGRLRLRHSASGNYRIAYSHETQGGFTVETNAELAFGREQAGLYPRKAIGIYGGGGWSWTADADHPVAIGGFSYDIGMSQYRLGTRYVHGQDRYPSIDFGVQIEIGGD